MLLEALFILGCTNGTAGGEEGEDPAECSDGEDNDSDGEIDCDDLGCAAVCEGSVEYGSVVINEFMASNSTSLESSDGGFYDWFELYNPGDEDVDLTGWTVTDDLTVPGKYELSGLVVEAGGFEVLYASDNEEELGDNHVGFHMNKDGESLAIYRPDGSPADELEYEAQATDLSAARIPDGSSDWVITDDATPGESNGE